MWFLLFIFTTTGNTILIPNYSSMQTCNKGGTELLQRIQNASPGAHITWICTHPE